MLGIGTFSPPILHHDRDISDGHVGKQLWLTTGLVGFEVRSRKDLCTVNCCSRSGCLSVLHTEGLVVSSFIRHIDIRSFRIPRRLQIYCSPSIFPRIGCSIRHSAHLLAPAIAYMPTFGHHWLWAGETGFQHASPLDRQTSCRIIDEVQLKLSQQQSGT